MHSKVTGLIPGHSVEMINFFTSLVFSETNLFVVYVMQVKVLHGKTWIWLSINQWMKPHAFERVTARDRRLSWIDNPTDCIITWKYVASYKHCLISTISMHPCSWLDDINAYQYIRNSKSSKGWLILYTNLISLPFVSKPEIPTKIPIQWNQGVCCKHQNWHGTLGWQHIVAIQYSPYIIKIDY